MYKHNGFIADPVDTKVQQASWAVFFLKLLCAEFYRSLIQIADIHANHSTSSLIFRLYSPDFFKLRPTMLFSMASCRSVEGISFSVSRYSHQRWYFAGQFYLSNSKWPLFTVFSFINCHGISAGLCYTDGSCNENKSSQRLRGNESHFIGFLLFFRRHSAVLAESEKAQSVIFVTGGPIYLSHSKSNVAERVSAKSCHASVRVEQFNFFRRKARFTCRETLSSKDIEHIYSNVSQSRQVGTIGVSITLLIFSLCIAIDSASLAHFVLAKFQSLPLFTQAVA